MSSTSLPIVRRIFDGALDLAGPERAAYLERECAGDATLRGLVESLLRAADDERFLSAPTSPSTPAAVREGPGVRLGPYELVERLGEGGFGVVFRARQEKPVAREVALKIVKLGMDTQQVVARFEQERQALARMDHPNIARVLDAGATDTGRPYFVMELVPGRPLVEYCDAEHLPIEARLELFEQVCRAVQHAHQKGIIHRDLKPSNLLVTLQDGRPLVKVIDFGIAKATGGRISDKTVFTEERQIIGTLQYMSPEQAEGSLDIDTRTDVYALGVVLYELLTGTTPFGATTLREVIYSEIQRVIREVDPPRPSTRISQATDELPSVAARRGVEPRRLGMLVRGDLDWIVMKALEKDRARRYESASDLALDVRRHLAGEAVSAAPPSAAYRIRKFVRRNRVAVLSGSAVAASLVVGAIAFAWQARVAGQERDRAVAAQSAEAKQRRIADEERAEARRLQALAEEHAAAEARMRKRSEATTEFVTQALNASDPNQGGARDVTVAEAMRAALERIDAGAFQDEPDLDAVLRRVIAEVLHSHGRDAEALPVAERALATHEELTPDGSTELASALNLVGTIQQDLGRLDRALSTFERALAMQRRLHPGDHEHVAMALNNLSLVLTLLGRYPDAVPLMEEALGIRERLVTGDDPELALMMNNLGNALDRVGREQEGLALQERALAMYERLFDVHPQLAMALYNVGQLRIPQGRLPEAESLLERALAMYREIHPGDHPDVARAISSVGNIRRILGKLAEAEAFSLEALAMKERVLGPDHPAVASELTTLVLARRQLGDLAGAEEAAARAVAIQRRIRSGDHPDLAAALDALATVLRDRDRPAEAVVLLEEALALLQRMLPSPHVEIARATNRLAAALASAGRHADAEARSREAVADLRRLYPEPHSQLAGGIAQLGLVLQDSGRPADAEPFLREALDIARRYYGRDHMDVALALENVAGCLQDAGREPEAQAVWAEAIEMHRRITPNGTRRQAGLLQRSGRAALDAGRPAEALPRIEEALALYERVLGASHATTVRCRELLDRCRAALPR